MLKLEVTPLQSYDSEKEMFVYGEGGTLRLEHSLVSLSKWESEFQKPFISEEPKTPEETHAYIRAMSLDEEEEISDGVLRSLTQTDLKKINEYIESKMTATFFSDDSVRKGGPQPAITADLIYYWMIALNMSVEVFEHWHLNRLIAQIKVVSRKNEEAQGGKKKGFTKEDLAQRKSINERRRAEAEAARREANGS